MAEARVRVLFEGDAEALKRTMQEIADLGSSAGQKAAESYERAQTTIKEQAARTTQTVEQAETARTAAAQKSEAAAERFAQLKAEAAAKYAAMSAEAEEKGIDHVRQQIFLLEKQKREIAQATTGVVDAELKKQAAEENKAVNASLQLYRSVEKEKTGGRTFTEIIEKESAAVRGSVAGMIQDYNHLKAERATIDRQMQEAATAEAKAELAARHAVVQKELAEQKELIAQSGKGASALSGAMGGMIGGALAGFSFGTLLEKGKAAVERSEQIAVGLRGVGVAASDVAARTKEATTSAGELSVKYGVAKSSIESATAAYLNMGGSADNLKEKQEMIIGLAQKAGISHEQAAKMLMKGTDNEVQAQLTRIGIKFAAGATESERYAAIQAKLGGTMEGLADKAKEPLGQFENFENRISSLGSGVGKLTISALGPFFNILGGVGGFINDTILPAFDKFGFVLKPIATVVGIGALAFGGYTAALMASTFAQESSVVSTLKDSVAKAAHTAVELASTVAKVASAAATWALNAAMVALTSPISLVVIGVGLLIGGLVYAYNHSETFRNVCNQLWESLKTGVEWFLRFGNPIGLLITGVKSLYDHFEGVRHVIDGVIDTVKSAGSAVMKLLGLEQSEADKAKQLEEEKLKASEEARKKKEAADKKAHDDKEAALDESYNAETRATNLARNKGQISEEQHRKSMLKIDVDYWKQKVANAAQYSQDDYDAQEKLHQAEVKVEEDKKKERAEHAKAAKDAHAKKVEDIKQRAEDAKAEAETKRAEGGLTERAFQLQLLAIQRAADEELLALKGNTTKEITRIKQDERKLDAQGRKNDITDEQQAAQLKFDLALQSMAKRRLAGTLLEKQEGEEKLRHELELAKDLLAIAQKNGQDTIKLETAVAEKEMALRNAEEGGAKAAFAMKQAFRKDYQKALDERHKAELAMVTDVRVKNELQYQFEVADIKEKLEAELDATDKTAKDGTRTVEQAEKIKAEIRAKYAAQSYDKQKEFTNKQREEELKRVSYLTGPITNMYQQGMAALNQKFFGPFINQIKSSVPLLGEMGGAFVENIIKMGEQAVTTKLTQMAMNLIFGEATTTSLVGPATLASIASFGGADAAAIAGMASANVAGLSMFAHAEGGLFTDPIFTRIGQDLHVGAERSPELMMPLDKFFAGVMPHVGGNNAAMNDKLDTLIGAVHGVGRKVQQQQLEPIVMDSYQTQLSINRATAVKRRGRIGN